MQTPQDRATHAFIDRFKDPISGLCRRRCRGCWRSFVIVMRWGGEQIVSKTVVGVAKFSGLRQRPDQHILCCAASRSRVGYRSDTDRIVEVWIRQHDTMGSYVVRASGVPLYVGYGSVFSIVSCIGLKLDRFVMQMALLLFHARTSARPPMTTEPTSPRHVGKHAMLARLASCPFMSLSELFDTCVRHDRTLFLLLVLIILQ